MFVYNHLLIKTIQYKIRFIISILNLWLNIYTFYIKCDKKQFVKIFQENILLLLNNIYDNKLINIYRK